MHTTLLPARGHLLLFLVWLLSLGASAQVLAQSPTVTTDRADYLPGDIVVIEGDNWQPGEQVQLSIDHSTVTHGNTVLYATADADADGHILNNQFVIQPVHLGETFELTATGLNSGWTASTTFTDGNAPGSLSVVLVDPAGGSTIPYGTGSKQYTVLVTRLSGGNDNGSFNVALSIDPTILSSTPKGISYSFSANPIQFVGGELSKSAILTITTTTDAAAMAGAFSFRVVGFTAGNNGNGNGNNNNNNNGVTVSGTNTFQIVPQAVLITPTAGQNKVYNAIDPTFTYANNAGLPADKFSGSLGRVTGENVGSYSYQLGSLTAGGNYQLSLGGTEKFRIDKAPATLTLGNLTGQVYDGSGKAATVTTNPAGLSGVALLYNGATALPINAGDYTVSATLTNPNYTATSVTGTLRIAPAPATIVLTSDDLTQTYDGNAKTVRATANPSAAGVAVSYSKNGNSVATPTNAGTYDVAAVLTNPNYQLVINGQPIPGQQLTAQLQIGKASQTIDWPNPETIIYGTALSSTQLNATLTAGNGALIYQPASGAVLGAGNNTLTVAAAETDNYRAATKTVPLQVGRKPLAPVVTVASKVYDATTAATILTRTLTGGSVGTDDVTLTGGTAQFATKNVGDARPVTVTGLSLSGAAAANYSLTATTTSASADIAQASITGSITADDKVYDATATATILTRKLDGVPLQDDVALTGGSASFATKKAAPGKTVTGTGFTLTGADAPNYKLADLPITTTASISALGIIGQFTAGNKVYDGNLTASVTGRSIPGVLPNDEVTLTGGSASFGTKDIGTGKPVTLAGASLSGADAGNYSLTAVAPAAADITALGITGAFTAQDKTYDGTTSATILTRSLNGAVAGDAVTLTGGAATFDNKKAGSAKTVTLSGSGLSGDDAGNYTLTAVATTTATISQRPLHVTATANSKTYDGNVAASATLQDDHLDGDQLTPTFATATFADKQVGTGKQVTVTGIILSGPDAANYLPNSSTTTTADILARSLVISLQASDKVYDGTTSATAAAQLQAGSGLVSGDVVTVSASNAQFDTPAAGTGKTVTASVSKAGSDAGNYSANATAETHAAITRRALTAGLIGTVSKQYDRTTVAALTPANYSLNNTIGGDDVSLNAPASGEYDTRHVGTAKQVTVTGLALGGSAAGNYSLPMTTVAGTVGQITARPLLLTATGQDKVYDGNTSATVSLTDNRLTGDVLSTAYGSATFADKRVGTGKTVTVVGLSISGADAGNYSPNPSTTTTSGITKLGIQGSITASNKTYDGTRAAAASATLTGPIAGDDVTAVVADAQFNTALVGTNKPVQASLALQGEDAGNYSVNSTAATTAAIMAKMLTASISAQSKTYDGTTAATATGTVPPASLIPGDVVTVAVSNAAFDTRWAGTGKTVQATVALGGAAADNYSLTSTTATTTANINQLAITGTFTAADKEYDGTTPATINSRALLGVLSIDNGQVSLTGGTAAFNTSLVGSNKPVAASGMALGGPAAANYQLASVAPTTASITPAVVGVAVTAAEVQYSDKVTLVATLNSATVQNELNNTGGSVEFRLKSSGGTVTTLGSSIYPAGWSTVNGKATVSQEFLITQAPDTYTVQAIFTPNPGNIGRSTYLTAGTLTVKPEDAKLTYTGETYYTLPSASATSFNVLLSATVKDISALTDEPRYDALAGNISNARVSFRLGSPTGTVLGSAPVALVAAADAKTGTASVLYNCPITNANQTDGGLTLTVYPVVSSFYTDVTLDPVTITLSLPGTDFVTGGGYLVNSAASRGTLAGTSGAKTNFGFTMKYTRTGTNLKGQCNIIVRSAGRTYQIKSNAINTLSVGSTSTAGTPAYFTTKANYTDITDPLNPVPGPGNLDLTVWMNDLSTGGQGDAAGMQLMNGSQLLFASNWNGTKTVTQALGGGNVQVRNALASAAASSATAARPATAASSSTLMASAPAAGGRGALLEVYPNPISGKEGWIHFRSGVAVHLQVMVYNEVGALVARLHNAGVQAQEDLTLTLDTDALPNGFYLCRVVANGQVLNHRFTVSR